MIFSIIYIALLYSLNSLGHSWKWSNFIYMYFLAHLSRWLTRWAYSRQMVRRPSVVVHTFKLEYLWSQLVNLDQIGVGEGCIRLWGRLDQNSGFHGNRKPSMIYNRENDVSTFSQLFLIRSFVYLQVMRTCIKSWMSSNFGQIRSLTTELAALERLKTGMSLILGRIRLPTLELLALEWRKFYTFELEYLWGQ